ncbi:hypothetical protein BPC006_II2667 [Burkholderia pseudomallei BPC006]|uniref:Uncharacterized protein n=1 Tax=Burkholderia pseudomallei (strain 1106a) TaxID=357348 RepID=A3P8S6_BURP0|nr:hypothetical protein BURPS1106A_A2705 [Burkholderia pseudomallei 1106a]AFR20592.1 hypothetical protein BPC006_II2667 [Burkholderia pseudomallei BPC006]EEH27033.1 conserved hypothetical protein [Burkholderia pseudomallei Pakistan 9]
MRRADAACANLAKEGVKAGVSRRLRGGAVANGRRGVSFR